MKISKTYLIMLCLFYCSTLKCQEDFASSADTSSAAPVSLDLEINGILVDETQSKIGKDFYELFYQNWNPPQTDFDYSIVFQEKAQPSFGAQISVIINDFPVFIQFVQPRYEKIEQMVGLALANATGYLENFIQIQNELKFDEMKGTGIF